MKKWPVALDKNVSRYSDSLRTGRSGVSNSGGRQDSSAPVHTGPGGHQASSTMGTGSLQGIKRPGSGVNQPPFLAPRVKEGAKLYLYSPSGPS
jgi:hypothetical protein